MYSLPKIVAYRVQVGLYLPKPYQYARTQGVIDYEQDDFKWSVYAQKKLAGCFSLIGQVANDHIRMLRHDDRETDREEVLRKKEDWHYMVKVKYEY